MPPLAFDRSVPDRTAPRSSAPASRGRPHPAARLLTSLTVLLAAFAAFATFAFAQQSEGVPGDAAPLAQLRPGQVTEVVPEGTLEPAAIQRMVRPIFFGDPVLENAVDRYRIRFATTTPAGEIALVPAQLFVPRLGPEAGARPLYAFGSGTTGLAPACAPSREDAYGDHPLGYYGAYVAAYAARGFVAIIPDYLGFDQPGRYQEYFNAVAEAHVLLDAVRAVHAFLDAPLGDAAPPPAVATHPAPPALSPAVFTAGYSQGGHAAFAAADLRPVYAPEVPLAGAIGFGATTNVERLLRDGPYYAPYIALSYAQSYEGFDPAEVLAKRWLPQLETIAGTECVDRAQQIYPFDAAQIYAPAFRAALYGGTLERDFPRVHAALEANRTGLSGHGLPSLLVQGGADIIATDAAQEAFVAELCERGSPALYLNYPQVRHRFTRAAGFDASIAWMKDLAAGAPAPTSCGVIE